MSSLAFDDRRPAWWRRALGARTGAPWSARFSGGAEGGVLVASAAGPLAAWTDRGAGWKYDSNQDGLCVAEREDGALLLAVCDGVGGNAEGGQASDAALIALEQGFLAGESLEQALQRCAPAIAARAAELPDLTPLERSELSTTIVAAVLEGRTLRVAHSGDSRLLLCRDAEVRFATEEHTVAQALVNAGQLAPELAGCHPDSDVLTRVVRLEPDGTPQPLEPDLSEHQLQPGDRVLLCSDGADLFVPSELAALLQRRDPAHVLRVARRCIRRWVDDSNRRASVDDNLALIVLRVR